MKRKLAIFGAAFAASALALGGCSSADDAKPEEAPESGDAAVEDSGDKEITLWVIGGDTPEDRKSVV